MLHLLLYIAGCELWPRHYHTNKNANNKHSNLVKLIVFAELKVKKNICIPR